MAATDRLDLAMRLMPTTIKTRATTEEAILTACRGKNAMIKKRKCRMMRGAAHLTKTVMTLGRMEIRSKEVVRVTYVHRMNKLKKNL